MPVTDSARLAQGPGGSAAISLSPAALVWIALSKEGVERKVDWKWGATVKLPLASWWLMEICRGLVV